MVFLAQLKCHNIPSIFRLYHCSWQGLKNTGEFMLLHDSKLAGPWQLLLKRALYPCVYQRRLKVWAGLTFGLGNLVCPKSSTLPAWFCHPIQQNCHPKALFCFTYLVANEHLVPTEGILSPFACSSLQRKQSKMIKGLRQASPLGLTISIAVCPKSRLKIDIAISDCLGFDLRDKCDFITICISFSLKYFLVVVSGWYAIWYVIQYQCISRKSVKIT